MSDQTDIKKQVGAKIREARKARKLTQEELAQKLGLKRETVKGYESGRQNLTLDTLYKLSELLGVSFLIESK